MQLFIIVTVYSVMKLFLIQSAHATNNVNVKDNDIELINTSHHKKITETEVQSKKCRLNVYGTYGIGCYGANIEIDFSKTIPASSVEEIILRESSSVQNHQDEKETDNLLNVSKIQTSTAEHLLNTQHDLVQEDIQDSTRNLEPQSLPGTDDETKQTSKDVQVDKESQSRTSWWKDLMRPQVLLPVAIGAVTVSGATYIHLAPQQTILENSVLSVIPAILINKIRGT